MEDEILKKGLSREIKDLDDAKGVVTAYASAYLNEDRVGDIIMPGSFNKTVSEGTQKVKVLKNHITSQKLGVSLEMNPNDSYGLLTTTQFNLKKPLGRDTFTDIQLEHENKKHTDLSIGYRVVSRDKKDTRRITEIKLYEYSFLDFLGANPLAIVTDIKSLGDMNGEQIIAQMKQLTQMYNAQYSDGRLKDIETALKTLQTIEPFSDTLSDEAVAAELKDWLTNYQLKNYCNGY